MKKQLLLLSLLASCAQLNQNPQSQTAPAHERDVASFEGANDCIALTSKILSNAKLTKAAVDEFPYSEAIFDKNFYEYGIGFLLEGLEDISRRTQSNEVHVELAEKIENLVKGKSNSLQILKQLSSDEKKSLWISLYRPYILNVEEEMLQVGSEQGDEIATFLLTVPRGELRENAHAAAALMRNLEPSIEAKEIVSRLSRRMSACIRK